MRILISIILSLLVLNCSKKEDLNFRIYDLDIYSIPIDEESTQQEVYASAKVEGFKTIKENGNYKFHILLEADLITPDKKVVQSITKLDTIGVQSEKFGKYLNLEVSFILDEKYPLGKYQIILRGKDLMNNEVSETKQEFTLD
ncbi:MAG: hypothetical protein ACK4G1_04525 [Ignavibacteria bacterium]